MLFPKTSSFLHKKTPNKLDQKRETHELLLGILRGAGLLMRRFGIQGSEKMLKFCQSGLLSSRK